MSSVSLTPALAERLNDQYWNSDRTIDEIIGSEGISRNRLYESVRPYSIANRCQACGEELVFPNRRSRVAGTALCPACGTEANVERPGDSEGAEANGSPSSVTGGDGSFVQPDGWGLKDRKKAIIGGVAALGVMLGAAATRVIKD